MPGRPFLPGDDPRRGKGPPKGRGGRPPDAVKAALLEAFAERLHILSDIADNPQADPAVRIRALDVLARYAGLQSVHIQSESRGILVSLPMPEGGQ